MTDFLCRPVTLFDWVIVGVLIFLAAAVPMDWF